MNHAAQKLKIAEWQQTVPVGTIYTFADVYNGTGLLPSTEAKRRHRELREAGIIHYDTYREDPTLHPREYRRTA